MKYRRVFVPPEQFQGQRVLFSLPDVRYLKKVLRLHPDDRVEVFDGETIYSVRLALSDGQGIVGLIEDAHPETEVARIKVVLACACVRPGPFSEILRHGTELGVSRFIPLLTQRSNRRPAERKERWEAIIQSAVGQSRGSRCPEVEAPVTLEAFLEQESKEGVRLLLSLSPSVLPLLCVLEAERPSRVTLLVGPEGGLDPSEEAMSVRSGFIPVGLGASTLRTETASILAAGMCGMWRQWLDARDGGLGELPVSPKDATIDTDFP